MILGSISQGARPVPDPFVPQALPKSCATVRLYRAPWGSTRLHGDHTFAADEPSGSWLAYSGNPFWRSTGRPATAASLLQQLSSSGLEALNDLDGGFAIAWWQLPGEKMLLVRDRFGIEPLHYHIRRGRHAFRLASARRRRDDGALARSLSPQGLAEYLTYCYTPGNTTLLDGILRVPAGGAVIVGSGAPVVQTWYRLSFANPWAPNEAEITANYRRLLEQSVVSRLDDSRAGLFLSGGMDSSSVATFAMRHLRDPISTFSFHCVGRGARRVRIFAAARRRARNSAQRSRVRRSSGTRYPRRGPGDGRSVLRRRHRDRYLASRKDGRWARRLSADR